MNFRKDVEKSIYETLEIVNKKKAQYGYQYLT